MAPLRAEAHVHPLDGPDADVRIWIDAREVRFNIIMNLAFVDEVVDAPREDETALHPLEYEGVREALLELYRAVNRVEIDGVEVAPLDGGFEVDQGDPSLLPLFPKMGTKALIKVRLVLGYPVKSAPQSISMLWGVYPPDLVLAAPGETPSLEIRAQLMSAGRDAIITFTDAEPEYIWHASDESEAERFLPVPAPVGRERVNVPVIALGCAVLFALLLASWPIARRTARARRLARRSSLLLACGTLVGLLGPRIEIEDPLGARVVLPDAQRAEEIFRPLHANIYRAFDYRSEDEIYDALARSVHGDLLDGLYREVYTSLIMQDQGGAVSRVQGVRLLASEVEEIGLLPPAQAPGFRLRARWQVDGTVFHWGHSHSRTNEYLALYTVVEGEAGWRISGCKVLEQQRVETAPGTGM
jgi:hypothetical protein